MSKYNRWLRDSETLEQTDFADKYYLIELCNKVSNFLQSCPVHVICPHKRPKNHLIFRIGSIRNFALPIHTDIAHEDFLTLLDQELRPFYPQYVIKVQKERKLTTEEIAELVKTRQFKSVPETFEETIAEETTEIGIIERIVLLNDEFILSVNGVKTLRVSGNAKAAILLSDFLKELRNLEDSGDKKNFIFNNSLEIRKLPEPGKVVLSHSGKKLYNFFKINLPLLADKTIIQIDSDLFEWDRFQFSFKSKSLEEECLALVTSFQKENTAR